jgi:hypothetical protein
MASQLIPPLQEQREVPTFSERAQCLIHVMVNLLRAVVIDDA